MWKITQSRPLPPHFILDGFPYLTIYVFKCSKSKLKYQWKETESWSRTSGVDCYQETSSQHPRADTERIKWVAAAIINCRVSQNIAPTPYNVYSSNFMCLQFTESNGNVSPRATRWELWANFVLKLKIEDKTLIGSKNPSVIYILIE